jgi:AcrR family transcriptional regulator
LDHRRACLLRAGMQLLGLHDGPPPVAAIAKAAGVSKGLLYHYFPDKEDFLLEVVRSAVDEITEATATDPNRPVPEQIAQAVDGFLDYAEAHSPGLRVIFGVKYHSPKVLRFVRQQRAARVDRVIEQVASARPDRVESIRASAALRTALDGALSFMETVTLRWLEERALGRPEVRTLLIGALSGAIELAQRIDPELDLEPATNHQEPATNLREPTTNHPQPATNQGDV